MTTPAVQSMVAVTYVRDVDSSRAFYRLLGFEEHRAGTAETSAWSALRHNGHSVVLASTRPPLAIPQLPLLFYFYYDDLDAAVRNLTAAEVDVTHVGYPQHALGGEVRLTDPDGNTVLLGQRQQSASQPAAADAQVPGFSLLREAAALVAARGGATVSCEVTDSRDGLCQNKADVKLADSWGDTAWACLAHAGEILVSVRGAFIASPGDHGIAQFVADRASQPAVT